MCKAGLGWAGLSIPRSTGEERPHMFSGDHEAYAVMGLHPPSAVGQEPESQRGTVQRVLTPWCFAGCLLGLGALTTYSGFMFSRLYAAVPRSGEQAPTFGGPCFGASACLCQSTQPACLLRSLPACLQCCLETSVKLLRGSWAGCWCTSRSTAWTPQGV